MKSLSQKTSKRVPGQYHLTLNTLPTFKGLPLLEGPGGFVSEYLDRLYCTIHRALQNYSRVFAVRIDLHFPRHYHPVGQETFSNEYLHSFIKSLRHQLQKYGAHKKLSGQRVHDVSFEYVWAREQGSDCGRPHFHLLLLFSGHAFNTLGHFSSECESLFNRIGVAWAEALKLYAHEGVQFVHFPVDSQYHVRSGDLKQLSELFCRASYLAKVETKRFHEGFHVFGANRSGKA